MTKSKRYSRNLAKPGLLLNALLATILISGCSSSTKPTYLREEIPAALENICQKEYDINVSSRLIGKTLWVYFPAEDIFEETDKPDKYIERFLVSHNDTYFKDMTLRLDYYIEPIIPEREKLQDVKLKKDMADKINDVWSVIRRTLFSMDRSNKHNEPEFICVVTADISKGIEIKQLSYYLDLKKVSYSFISAEEYQHRTLQDFNLRPDIIGDKEGLFLPYNDITLREFVASQIQYRIRLKFQKPEVNKDADIDKEIIKIVDSTLKIYHLSDFDEVELNNIPDEKKVILSSGAIEEKAKE